MMEARTLALWTSLAGVTISLVVTVGVLIFVIPRLFDALQGYRTNPAIKHGRPVEASIRSISQTGLFLNQMPQMQMLVSVHEAGGERELTLKQFVDLGNIPRTGERVRLLIDDADPTRAVYVGLALPETRL